MRLRPRPRSTAPPDAVDTAPPLRQLLPLGLQHVLVAYSGMATVPLLIGLGIGLPTEQIAVLVSANVLVSGIATLLQALGVLNIGARLPIVMGSTFTGITPAILVGKDGGLPAVFGATIVAGLLTWLVAPWFSRLMRFFPPIVTGTIIAIIGFSLLPSTSKLIAGTDPAAADFASPTRLLMALGTILLVVLLEAFAPAAIARFAILTALVLGTLVALPLGLADFSAVGEASWFGAVHPFAFGLPEFTIAAILPMIIIQLVNMVESTGDTLAIGQIAGRDVGREELARALRADGVGTAVAGVFNSFTIVTFGENVGLVSMTRVLSRFVVATAGALLVVIGLLPKLAAVVASLPGPVLGGVGVVMFGTVGAVGVKIMAQADLGNPRNILIVAISFGFGLLPVGAPEFYANLPGVLQPVLSSGIAAGGIAAFLLNLVLNRRTS
ncbi:nucleobase:cation symporter-2 family protein [Saccharopolyspora sp. WRP15-2]|uniref:Nucleobase:cation symporter-2 family protein n=1 Tax=Saccharopolyspora oryzae TaxID=2997343 RepID=A0ABT4V1A5_9PSEU|nr:nucleobase:cation symporter-2 family protein [Saccharopolyspora oryzae]MDA3627204.1 nucleobase:cation symporter-2 family protein [Saccharopolyspora oryzae]